MGDGRKLSCWYDGKPHPPYGLERTLARNEHGPLAALIREEIIVVAPPGGAGHAEVLGREGFPELAKRAAQPRPEAFDGNRLTD
jgi:hypothetical protein